MDHSLPSVQTFIVAASYYFLDPDGHKLELHVDSLAQRLTACRERPYQGMVFYEDGDV